MDICEKAVSFEMSRLSTGGATGESDATFVRLMDSCESVCRVISTNPIQIDPQEHTAVEILVSMVLLNFTILSNNIFVFVTQCYVRN